MYFEFGQATKIIVLAKFNKIFTFALKFLTHATL